MRKLVLVLLMLTSVTALHAQGSRPVISADTLSHLSFLTALVGQIGYNSIQHLKFTADGHYLLANYESPPTLALWDIQTYKPYILAGSTSIGTFALDDRRLIWYSGSSEDFTLHVWNLDAEPVESVKIVSVNPDKLVVGKTLLAVQGPPPALDIVDMEKGAIRTVVAIQHKPDLMWFSPDEHYIVVRYPPDNPLRYETFDTDTGKLVTPPEEGAVPIFSWDGKYVAWLATNKLILRGRDDDKTILETNVTVPAYDGVPQWFVFSPDSQRLAFHAADGRVTLLTIATGQQHIIDSKQEGITFGTDSKLLWTYDKDKANNQRSVLFWNAQTGKLVEGEADFETLLYAISPDEQTAILQVYHTHPSLVFVNLQTGERSAELPMGDLAPSAFDPPPQFTRDGRSFIMFEGSTLGTWDLATKTLTRFMSKRGQIYGVKFTPDGRVAMIKYGDGIELRDMKGSTPPIRLAKDMEGPQFNADFTLVAVPVREVIWLYSIPAPNDLPRQVAIPANILPVVNLYAKPAYDATVLDQIFGYVIVVGQNAQHDFIYVRNGNRQEGWIHYSPSRVSTPPEAKSILLPVITSPN